MKAYWIYILECSNSTFYTGYTTDLDRRFKEHLQGTAKCKYTRSFKPLRIAQSWQIICDQSKILSLERSIKKLSKQKKQHLILNPDAFHALLNI